MLLPRLPAPLMARRRFIQRAIKRPGNLTRAVGGKPSRNLPKVRKLAKRKGRTGREARFYLYVLRPASKRRRRRK